MKAEHPFTRVARRLTALAAIAFLICINEHVQAQEIEVRAERLFLAAEEGTEPGALEERGTIRSRMARPDAGQLADARQPGARLTINLFDDATFEAVVERVSATRGDGYVITARLVDSSGGEMMLAVNGPAVEVVGSVWTV